MLRPDNYQDNFLLFYNFLSNMRSIYDPHQLSIITRTERVISS